MTGALEFHQRLGNEPPFLRVSSGIVAASLHGWDHLRRCHTTVVALLRQCFDLGAHVRIVDEGGWWPRRSETTLRRSLESNNQLVAAMAGALKDDSDPDRPSRVVSPIFAHPQFERLESDGVVRNAAKITGAARIVSDLARRKPRQ